MNPMWKECKIIMLPTEKAPQIIKDINRQAIYPKGKLLENHSPTECLREGYIFQHLYILSDDEIKKEEFDILLTQGLYFESNNGMIKVITTNRVKTLGIYKKIIACTDSSLNIKSDCDCGATTFEGCSQCLQLLPQIPEEFIQLFIQKYNSGKVIDKVLVEYTTMNKGYSAEHFPYQEIDILKLDSENKINIKLLEEKKYSREEVIQIAWNAWHFSSFQKKENTTEEHFKQWTEENLK